MLNYMSLVVLRQLFMTPFTNLFPAKRIPDDLTGALALAAEGKIKLNDPVPTYGRFRGRLNYNRAKCIGCGMCIKVCPANSIERDPQAPRKVMFHGDRCCFCAQCNDICPVQCLSMTRDFAISTVGDRKTLDLEKDGGAPQRAPFQKEWTVNPAVKEYSAPDRPAEAPVA